MTKQDFRELALLVLDSEDGISEFAYDKLFDLMKENGDDDIIAQVDSTNGKFYIGEDFAEQEIKKLKAPIVPEVSLNPIDVSEVSLNPLDI